MKVKINSNLIFKEMLKELDIRINSHFQRFEGPFFRRGRKKIVLEKTHVNNTLILVYKGLWLMEIQNEGCNRLKRGYG